jgi:hypothetical protein
MKLRSKGVRIRNPLGGIIGGPLIILFGLGIAYFGWSARARTLDFIADSSRAAGSVVEMQTRQDSEGDTLFYPVVEFTTADGEIVRFRSSTGSNPPRFEVGEEVEVLYDPLLPENARVSSFVDLWLFPTILLAFGGIFLLFGLIGFFNSLLVLLGIGGLLGIGAWLMMRGKPALSEAEVKEEEEGVQEKTG